MSTEEEFNPYRRPAVSDVAADAVTGTRRPGPIAIAVVVLASLIAAGATFFFTCLGALAVADTTVGEGQGVSLLSCDLLLLAVAQRPVLPVTESFELCGGRLVSRL